MRKIVSVILVLLCISIALGVFLHSQQKDRTVLVLPNLPIIRAVPSTAQIVVFPTEEVLKHASSASFFNDIPLLMPLLEQWSLNLNDTKSVSRPLCAFKYENSLLSGLYVLPNNVASQALLSAFLLDVTLNTDEYKKINVNEKEYNIYPLRTGGFLTVYTDQNIMSLSTSYVFVEQSIEAMYGASTDKQLLSFYMNAHPDQSARTICYFKPNIVPLGREGEYSLEELTSNSWVEGLLFNDSNKISMKVDLPNNTTYKLDSYHEPLQISSRVPKGTVAINYFSKTTADQLWKDSSLSQLSTFDKFWNQEVKGLLLEYLDRGMLVYSIKDTVTITQHIASIPLKNTADFKDRLLRLIGSNRMEIRKLLREETIDGYWKIDVLPAPQGLKSIVGVNDDDRLMYYYLSNDELLLSFNYHILYAYLFKEEFLSLSDLQKDCLESVSSNTSMAFWGELVDGVDSIQASNKLIPSFVYNRGASRFRTIAVSCEVDSLLRTMKYSLGF